MAEDHKAPKEILALLVFLGEMVILVSQDNQVLLVLLEPLESVNHVPLAIRIIHHNMTHMMSSLEDPEELQATLGQLVPQVLPVPLAHLVILVPLVLQDTKVPLVNLDKLVLQVLQDLLVLLVHLALLEKMENQEDQGVLENEACLVLRVSKAQLACLDSPV